jgi:hypothetical protein
MRSHSHDGPIPASSERTSPHPRLGASYPPIPTVTSPRRRGPWQGKTAIVRLSTSLRTREVGCRRSHARPFLGFGSARPAGLSPYRSCPSFAATSRAGYPLRSSLTCSGGQQTRPFVTELLCGAGTPVVLSEAHPPLHPRARPRPSVARGAFAVTGSASAITPGQHVLRGGRGVRRRSAWGRPVVIYEGPSAADTCQR